MTTLEKLCLPGCGYDLSILSGFVVPGYDDFQPMINESILEKVNKHGINIVGDRQYTQLGVSQDEITKNKGKFGEIYDKNEVKNLEQRWIQEYCRISGEKKSIYRNLNRH